ncbi:cytochrome P450 [Trametes versicolor FP-101664 SS1]|uniref:cytochrome P450 n=1 Tax=Trametes versicolor (strain FP-101664) TaxID=717944 RepID=UPI00046249F8|nr:cytochrome P450 [Trametes versicolor FP-101664 SS1]EIW57372.1 cytochrome P450 [Trametes versicolor FP-101664 SS1]
MPTQLVQAAVICGITWMLWRFCRQWVVKSSLDNIPGPSSNSWVYGNLSQLLALDSWPFHNHLLENYPGIASLKGSFGSKILYVFEPSALHHVFVKDQYIYDEGQFFFRSNELLLGKGLLATWGDHHRKQRKMLNPVFSPKHMRHMVPIFYDVGRLLVRAIDERVRAGAAELDINEWMGRTALEFVGQAGLGYSFDPLVNDKADEFASSLKSFSGALAKAAIPRRILPYLPRIQGPFAGLGRWLMSKVPHDGVQTLVALADKLWGRSTDIYSNKKVALERGESLGERVGDGKDIMSTLLKANMEASGEDKLAEEELIGQMGTLILAAVDTTSNALSLIMTRLAEHPDVQQKLREEILSAGADRGLDFDALMGLPLLEAVCRETLRMYVLSYSFRHAVRSHDVVLPLSQPIRGRDGSMIHEIHVPKDTVVVAGLLNCNRNKAIWGEDAYEWKPERFLSPLPSTVTEAKIPGVYSNLMTFLAGGRACIGFKFSQLEMKVILSLLLSKFTFEKTAQPIIWNMAGVRYPSVGKYGGKASLPMKVSLYKGAGI